MAQTSNVSAYRSTAVAEFTPGDVYELPTIAEEIPAEWKPVALYTLEAAVRCPHCHELIRTVRIVGLTRTQVTFTSTLPRKGRILACPQCESVLSAELSGLV